MYRVDNKNKKEYRKVTTKAKYFVVISLFLLLLLVVVGSSAWNLHMRVLGFTNVNNKPNPVIIAEGERANTLLLKYVDYGTTYTMKYNGKTYYKYTYDKNPHTPALKNDPVNGEAGARQLPVDWFDISYKLLATPNPSDSSAWTFKETAEPLTVAGAPTDAGIYRYIATPNSAAGDYATYLGSISIDFVIEPKAADVWIISDESIYGNPHTPAVTAEGTNKFLGTDYNDIASHTKLTYDPKDPNLSAAGDTTIGSLAGFQTSSPAGDYLIFAQDVSSNYAITYKYGVINTANPSEITEATSSDEVAFTIQKRKIEISFNTSIELSKVYGDNFDAAFLYKQLQIKDEEGTIRFEYNNENGAYSNLLWNSDEISSVISLTCDGISATFSVGNYDIIPSVISQNYEILSGANARGVLTIVKRMVTLTWKPTTLSLIYNSKNQAPTADIGNVIDGDDCTISVSGGRINANTTENPTYKATASLSGARSGNYCLPAEGTETNFTINPKEITITWTNTEFTYNNESHLPTAETNGLIDGDGSSLEVGDAQINADNYTATASIVKGDATDTNYKITSGATQAFTIAKATLTVEILESSSVYGAEISALSSKITVGSTFGSDSPFSLSTTATKTSSVGSYPITGEVDELHGGGNYNITFVNNGAKLYTITPAPLTIIADDIEITYGDDVSTDFTGRIEGRKNNDDITVTYTCDYQKGDNVGTYTITPSINDNNYKLPPENITKGTLTVNSKKVTITWDSTTLSFTYNGNSQCPTAFPSGLVVGDGSSLKVRGEQKNVGDYTATALITKDGVNADTNYTITGGETQAYKINPKSVEIVWNQDGYSEPENIYSFTYNKADQKPTANFVAGSLCDGDEDSCSIIYQRKKVGEDTVLGITKDVGSYTITATGVSNTNYVLKGTNLTQNYKISPKEVTITWSIENLVEGAYNFTYNGGKQGPTATIDDNLIYTGDDCSIIYQRKSGETSFTETKDVGSYTITATDVSNNNYVLIGTNLMQSYKISPKSININWDGNGATLNEATNVYEFTYNGNSQCLSASTNELFNDGSSLKVTAGAETKNVGNYIATASITKNNKTDTNYTISNATQAFTIVKDTLTVPANGNTYTYTGSNQYDTILGDFSDYSSATVNSFDCINAGDYTFEFTLNDVTATNYQWNTASLPTGTTVNGTTASVTITIAKAPLTVKAEDKTILVGSTIDYSKFTVTYGSFVNGENETVLTGTLSFETIDPTVTNTATVYSGVIIPKGLSSNNYAIEFVPGNLKVVDGLTQPTLVENTFDYDGNTKTISFNNFDDTKMTIANGSITSATDAGTYSVIVTLNDGNHWSDGTDVSLTFDWTIEKAVIEQPVDEHLVFQYTGAEQSFTLPASYNSTWVTLSDDTTATDIGTYKVTITPTDNYKWATDTVCERTWEISQRIIARPNITTTEMVYNGGEQWILPADYSDRAFFSSISGDKGTNATTYTLKISLDTTHCVWEDGTTSDFSKTWKITQATLTITNGTLSNPIVMGYNDVASSTWNKVEAKLREEIVLEGVCEKDKGKVSIYTKTLTNGDITYTYNGTSTYSATYNDDYKITIGDKFFGSTYKATAFGLSGASSSNYKIDSNAVYYFKYKTVWYKASGDIGAYDNSELYTIEDALNTYSSGTIIVEYNTSFTGVEIAKAMGYLDASGNPQDNYYNIRGTLLVPYAADVNSAFKNTEEGAGLYGTAESSNVTTRSCTTTTTTNTTSPNRNGGYSMLIIASNLNINVTGTLTVNAVMTMVGGESSYVNGTNYGELIVNTSATISLKNGSYFYCNGFARGPGSIIAESNSTITEPINLTGYKGHNPTIAMSGSTFPINQFTLSSIACNTTVKYGAKYYGKGYIKINEFDVAKSASLIGTTSSFFVQIHDDTSTFVKSIDETNGKIIFGLNGTISINNLDIYNEKLPILGRVNISTAGRQIPIAGHFVLDIQSGTTTIPSGIQIKLLPGAEMIVREGANLVVNGGLFSYGSNNTTFHPDENGLEINVFKDGIRAYPNVAKCYRIAPTLGYNVSTPAVITVLGTITFGSGSTLGAEISGQSSGKMIVNTTTLLGTITEDNTPGSVKNIYTVTLSSRGLNEDNSLTPLNQGTWNYVDGKWVGSYYQIVYNSNGDSNAPAELKGEFSDVYSLGQITSSTITTPNPTRIYHTFNGWYYDAECTQKVGDYEHSTPVAGEVVNVYAGWTPIVYEVNFMVDYPPEYSLEQLGLPTGLTWSYGTTCELTLPEFNITGMEFTGWKSTADYSVAIERIDNSNISSVLIEGTKIKIYGQFKKENSITVIFNNNGNLYTTENEAEHKLNSMYNTLEFETVNSQGVINVDVATTKIQGIDSNHHEYYFNGWNTKADGTGTTYNSGMQIDQADVIDGTLTLYAQWARKTKIHIYIFKNANLTHTVIVRITPKNGTTIEHKAPAGQENYYYYFRPNTIISYYLENKAGNALGAKGYNKSITSGTPKSAGTLLENIIVANITTEGYKDGTFTVPELNMSDGKDREVKIVCDAQGQNTCIVEGTLVTLADGTQKKVENLTYDDVLLVFNHATGQYEASSLLLNAHAEDGPQQSRIIYLSFSDGTRIGVVADHAFFDIELKKYVYISEANAKDFIGHRFAKVLKENNVFRTSSVILKGVEVIEKNVRVFSPVAYLQLSAIVEGLWGVTESINENYEVHHGYINIFDFDENMLYDPDKMKADIEKYGLYTYEEFSDLISYEEFMKGPWRYYKVSEGKGKVTLEDIRFAVKYVYSSRAKQGKEDNLPSTFPWEESPTDSQPESSPNPYETVALPPPTTSTSTSSSSSGGEDDSSNDDES